MSEEQQQAAIGRTVEDYAATKKKLAVLLSESGKIAANLTQIGQMLGNAQHAGTMVNVAAIKTHADGFPTFESLVSLVEGIQNETQRKHQLHDQLKNMGVEPKD